MPPFGWQDWGAEGRALGEHFGATKSGSPALESASQVRWQRPGERLLADSGSQIKSPNWTSSANDRFRQLDSHSWLAVSVSLRTAGPEISPKRTFALTFGGLCR